MAEELDRLADFQTVIEHAMRTREETDRLIQAEVKELAGIQAKLSQLRRDAQVLQAEIDRYEDILIVTEERRLAQSRAVSTEERDIGFWSDLYLRGPSVISKPKPKRLDLL